MSMQITRREREATWLRDKDGNVVMTKNGRPVVDPGKSLTKQEFTKECDINVIIKGFEKTGVLPVANLEGVFADVSQIGGYAEGLRLVTEARDAFMQLDPEIRERFKNDPQQLLAFIEDANNYDEAVKLGLIEKKEAPPPDPAEVKPPEAPPA